MLDHISHTQIQMLLKCGIQYQLRYLEKTIIPPNASLVRGRCGHKTLEKNFSQKIETKHDLPAEQVKDIFSDEWEKSKFEIAWSVQDLNGDSPSKATAKFKDSGIRLIGTFHVEQSPLIQPVLVEDKFEVPFEGDYPSLVGVIDRIDEGEEIGEVKFVGKSPQRDDAKTDIQLTIYDAAFRVKYGHPPKKLKKQFAIATKEPKTIVLEEPGRDEATINRLLNRLLVSMQCLKSGIFVPAPQGAWWCSPNWCGYWDQCNYHP
jgi:hypothetical protein